MGELDFCQKRNVEEGLFAILEAVGEIAKEVSGIKYLVVTCETDDNGKILPERHLLDYVNDYFDGYRLVKIENCKECCGTGVSEQINNFTLDCPCCEGRGYFVVGD